MQTALDFSLPADPPEPVSIESELRNWCKFGKDTRVEALDGIPVFINEFWTSKQRAAHRLHEVSYRACFKPQLPRFFIDRLTREKATVYDPFMGRGTTVIESALNARYPIGCDINPLSKILVKPRLYPPSVNEIWQRLRSIDLTNATDVREDLLVFYHPETLHQICSLREHFIRKEIASDLDHVDDFIRMVAVNRLTGHSAGFFSVYSLPPNQAVSIDSQRKINERRDQTPPLRSVVEIILKKSKVLLSHPTPRWYGKWNGSPLLITGRSESTPDIKSDSIDLVVTSPPFLNIVNYRSDNWLRCWFCGIDPEEVEISSHKSLQDWMEFIKNVFSELARIVKPSGHVAFEVGEIHHGKVRLEEAVLQATKNVALEPQFVLINDQEFTKTANCWGVSNNSKGTNTNRVILFKKP